MTPKTDVNILINRSFTYILPMIGFAYKLKLEDFKGFQGCFIRHANYPELDEHVFIRFKHQTNVRSKTGVTEYLKCVNEFVLCDTEVKGYVVICLKVCPEYKREYDKFIKSKYSEFSENYKKCIVKFHNMEKNNSGRDVLNVLYKTEEGYRVKEEMINQGLPEHAWTRIPRGQEIGMVLSEIIHDETYRREDYQLDTSDPVMDTDVI